MKTDRNKLLASDLVVRFDPAAKNVLFFTVNPVSGLPASHALHQHSWNPRTGIEGVIDVGAGVCAHMYASHSGEFCTDEEWERIAEAIRIATGRDEET